MSGKEAVSLYLQSIWVGCLVNVEAVRGSITSSC